MKTTDLLASLLASKYLSLGTWRKNGAVVDTPVWFAADDGVLYVFSSGDAGKVKRLRNSSKARVAPCSVSGKVAGDWLTATAEIIQDDADTEVAYQALRHRYGWQMLITDFMSKMAGKISKRVFIRITLAAPNNDTPS